jgi:CheY-like chemotaxis protein
LVNAAMGEITRGIRTDVLIIEDETVIALDLAAIVEDMGHSVSHIAISRSDAVKAAQTKPPGLILADIQLADDSSGIDAVKDILAQTRVPAIFITAYPERLLTGERPEPTFLITKPFLPDSVKAAIGQALFFHPRAA